MISGRECLDVDDFVVAVQPLIHPDAKTDDAGFLPLLVLLDHCWAAVRGPAIVQTGKKVYQSGIELIGCLQPIFVLVLPGAPVLEVTLVVVTSAYRLPDCVIQPLQLLRVRLIPRLLCLCRSVSYQLESLRNSEIARTCLRNR